MKPMAFNLRGAKKVASDKHASTFELPSGHQIKIAHSAVSPLQRKQLERMPVHMAVGGIADEVDAPAEETETPGGQQISQYIDNARAGNVIDTGGALNSDESYSTAPIGESPKAPELPDADPNLPGAGQPVQDNSTPSNPPPTTTASAVPSGNPVDLNSAYQLGQKAIGEQQNVSSQLAKNQANVEQNDIVAREQLNNDVQKNSKDFQEHQKQTLNDYINGHIDPNHFQENMGTGQKVATAIGLLLGGFTGGFNKTGVNPAADWLNQQIGRDIEAQRSKLDQQKTLLGANQDLYHDQVMATNATRANLNDIYSHQLQLEAAKLGTPQAKAAADTQSAKLMNDSNNALYQNSVRASALERIKNGGNGLDPITLGQAGLMSPEEAQKEQGAFLTHKAGISRINDLFAQANKEQTAANLINPQSYKATGAINAQLINNFMTMDVNHRYSPESAKDILKPNLINTTDDARVRTLKQNNILAQAEAEAAGSMPNFSRLAPGALPKYSIPSESQAPKYNVGDIVFTKSGQKGQVLANGQIKAVK